MSSIILDSFGHYQFRDNGDGRIQIICFGRDCPGMGGERKPYTKDEGILMGVVKEGSCATFGGPNDTSMKITKKVVSDTVHCGDNLPYLLAGF